MKSRTQNYMIIALLLTSLVVTSIGATLAAEPTIGQVILTPEHPTPKSKATFSVDITGDSISSVRLIYKECNANMCYARQNVSMSKSTGDTYSTEVTLTHQDATYITYHIEVNSGGTWSKSEDINVTLSAAPNEDNNNDDKKTPGFELIPCMIAMGIIIIVIRSKRFR